MDAQSFLKNFGYIADAPDGVDKLRELILALAMQGKLLNQNSEDIPASVLVKEIETEKKQLVKNKKITRPKKFIEIKAEEKCYTLPASWEWVRFGSIAQHNAGKTLDKRRNTGQPRDYITTSNLYWGFFKLADLRQMLIKDEELERCTAIKGDLLICEGGEAGRAAVWLYDKKIAFQNHIHRCRFYHGVDPHYAYRFFEKLNATGEISQHRKGVGISNMSGKALAAIVFPLPPLEEQKRIVTKVDELMALCDKLEAQQQKRQRFFPVLSRTTHARLVESPTPANLKAIFDETEIVSPEDLRSTILSLAVNGKLTTQTKRIGKNEIDKIKSDKAALIAQKLIKREKPFYGFAGLDDIKTTIPDKWEWCRINDISSVVRGGSPRPAGDPRFYGGKIPFLKVADVTRSEGMMVDGYNYTIKEAGLKKTRLISSRTVLLTNSGATLGVPAICDFEAAFNDGIAAFIFLHALVFDEFLYLYLKSKSRWFLDIASRGQGQPNLNTDIIRATWFPVPPLEEQHRIVTKARELMTIVDKLEEQQEEKHKIAQTFAQASVTAITGTQIKEQEKMKVPKAELVTKLQIGKKPKKVDQAPLANFIARHKGTLSAKALWQQSGFKIDTFYQQLKIEMANGWIIEPEKATMQEVGAK